jgi:hypothetical protein
MNDFSDPHPTRSDHGTPALSAADARAVDAILELGYVPGARAPGDDRARKVLSLLSLLDGGRVASDAALVDVTLARVLQAQGAEAQEASLSFDDEAALDAWVMMGFHTERVPGSLRERARRHERLAAIVTTVETGSGAAPGALIERTLAKVQASIDGAEGRMNLENQRVRLGSGIRLADLVSVAAVLLIAAAVVWPVFNQFRDQSRKYACANNMRNTAGAFGSYALSNRDSLPMATSSFGGGPWWNVGSREGRSNSANLFQLTRSGYARLADLACPGNPAAPTGQASPQATDWRNIDEVSYSYQIMFGKEQPTWSQGSGSKGDRAVVMADRSPVVVKSIRGEAVSPLADSMNHRSHGQHVLFSDGSAEWLRSPVLANGDNIWLPRFIEAKIGELMGKPLPPPLSGQEMPDGADDAFVGP